MSRYPELIKEAQLNSIAIYDATDPVVVIVVTIREIIMEILCEYLEKSKYLFKKDLVIFKSKFRKKYKEKLNNKILELGAYYRTDAFNKEYFDITQDLFITVRVLYDKDPLYVPTEVRYYYGEI